MGTRINVLFAHQLSDWTDRQESLRILTTVLPAVNAVEDYWNTHGKNHRPRSAAWIAKPPFPPPETRDYLRYTGPGSFFVSINPSAVWIHTGGRWRGFLSIPKLREVHLAAFRVIVKAFSASDSYCFADNDFANGAFWDGRGVPDCIAVLQNQWGEPITLEPAVDPEVAKATDHGCPRLWYRDELL